MSSTLGQGLVLLALLICSLGAPVGFVAGARRSAAGLAWTRRLAFAFAATITAATVVMWVALVRHDFSVSYVAQVGSRSTPLHITLVSLWSSLDGSILFWGMVLGVYTVGVAYLQRRGHEDYLAYTLGTMMVVGVFFTYLLAGPANPFAPTPPPIPPDGPGPNPLLQNHVLMIVHPPTLYLGYVGMTVPFAMAVAALIRGQLGPTWLLPLRNWLLVPVAFLTGGIMLGGWWSYEVLGWGGYWAWDPVENASFLPWLTAVAALHSAIVQQRRGSQKAWTVILILVSFLLTILGTFLTRSGVVNSVHSFTQSPIGPIFLLFLGLLLVGVVVLLSLRVDTLVSEPAQHGVVAREGAFLLNNLLLVSLMFTVLVGTLFPIVAEAVRGVKVSVGEPYFNRMAVPIFLVLILLMGIGPVLPWGRGDRRSLQRALLIPLPAAAAGVLLTAVFAGWSPPMLITGGLAGYTLWVTAVELLRPTRQRLRHGEGAPRAFLTSLARSPRRVGAYLVHFGLLVTFVAVAISSTFQSEREATLRRSQSVELAPYTLTFVDIGVEREEHRVAQQATIGVEKNGRALGSLLPRLNHYPAQREPLATPAVLSTATHDLYLTLMNVGNDGTVGLRAILTPAVVWIWIGVAVMVFGTVLCLVPPGRLGILGVRAPVAGKEAAAQRGAAS